MNSGGLCNFLRAKHTGNLLNLHNSFARMAERRKMSSGGLILRARSHASCTVGIIASSQTMTLTRTTTTMTMTSMISLTMFERYEEL